jgi:Mg2+-importing ATPase
MRNSVRDKILKNKYIEDALKSDKLKERFEFAVQNTAESMYRFLGTERCGLSEEEAETAREKYGSNSVDRKKKESLAKRFADAFINPFTVVLLILAVVSVFTDIITAAPGEKNPVTVIIISVMVVISGTLRFVQETRSSNAAAKLNEMIKTTVCAQRKEAGRAEIPLEEVTVGDIIHLSAGDMIPADLRITFAKDLFVSQAALTGESEAVEKTAESSSQRVINADNTCLAFMGSTVISGSADAIVLAVGKETMLGKVAGKLDEKSPKTTFDKGVNSVSWLLIRFMLIMVPVVFFVNGITKGDWLNAALFAVSVAVGLTPEMLPMIVTTCLAKGAVAMSKKEVIIKNLNSIQNLGSMDILCTDKTGTLTQDKVVLEYHLDVNGNEDDRVLRHAFLNSYFQTGLKNLMDIAIIEHTDALAGMQPEISGIRDKYIKVDEIPFDFERRRMSVVVSDRSGKTQMITKGAVEEMLGISSYVEYNGQVRLLTDEMKNIVKCAVGKLNSQGMRVLGVAQKTNPSAVGEFSQSDESEMVLIGYLAFLDPPKKTARSAVKALNDYGVKVKVLTGDNEKVSACICRQVGIYSEKILIGSDIEEMSDEELKGICENTNVFAKLSPEQKARVVNMLKENGHCVGYMGDGINDAAAMKCADVGISVDTAVDIAKESADVILLEKDLNVLEDGIIEGRKTYANMVKYIKMTASSNFGNMLSVLAASAFLPFLPMAAIHLILLNLIYDISCTAVPWDNVDEENLLKPCKWDASSIGKFMLFIGPVSSVFDIATYLVMFFVICPAMCSGTYANLDASGKILFVSIFQSGWFIESMWTQSMVIHMIRTSKLPFIKSRASMPLTVFSLIGILSVTLIPFTYFGTKIGLHPLPVQYFMWLAGIILGYMVLVSIAKKVYIKKFKTLL